MSLATTTTLFFAMLVLALVPGVSVLTVTARTASAGFIHGLGTTLGIVAGDILFILLAIYGLSLLAEIMDDFFVVVKYLGGCYLVWLGLAQWRAKSHAPDTEAPDQPHLLSSFMAGLLITLADQKAILFYLGFFPAFIDIASISRLDTLIIIVVAALAIGIAKLGYALLVARTQRSINAATLLKLNRVAGSVLLVIGCYILVRT